MRLAQDNTYICMCTHIAVNIFSQALPTGRVRRRGPALPSAVSCSGRTTSINWARLFACDPLVDTRNCPVVGPLPDLEREWLQTRPLKWRAGYSPIRPRFSLHVAEDPEPRPLKEIERASSNWQAKGAVCFGVTGVAPCGRIQGELHM